MKISTDKSRRLNQKLYALMRDLVLLDKQKSLPFLSHRCPRNDRHPPGRRFHAPPPLIIQTTSATTPFVLRAAPAHVDWWTQEPFFFFFSFLIFPYVCMAHMTSFPSHLLHPDTFTHFSSFLSVTGGMGRAGGAHQLFYFTHTKKKKKNPNPRPAGNSSSHSDDITLC